MMPGLSQKDCLGGRGSEVDKMPPSACQELRYDLLIILLWSFIINETIVQQNRIETLHHDGNPLEKNEDARTSPVVSANRLPNSVKN